MNFVNLIFYNSILIQACSGAEVNQIQNVGNLEKIKALGSFGLIFDRIKNPGNKIDKICGDTISSKTCQKFKKKGKCGNKKVGKKCKLTCEKCDASLNIDLPCFALNIDIIEAVMPTAHFVGAILGSIRPIFNIDWTKNL